MIGRKPELVTDRNTLDAIVSRIGLEFVRERVGP